MEGFPERFFAREDESPDDGFYRHARLVTHIDDATIAALTDFYAEFLPPGSRVLDLMSSWVSHLPDLEYARIAGLGMNAEELAANPRLTDSVVHDLNEEPTLPYDDGSFDRAVVAVSVQYLVRPIEVFTDLGRVLAPGGRVAVAMSHRCFPTKAILAFRACHRATASASWGAICTRWFCRGQCARSLTRERGSPLDRHRGLSTGKLRRGTHFVEDGLVRPILNSRRGLGGGRVPWRIHR